MVIVGVGGAVEESSCPYPHNNCIFPVVTRLVFFPPLLACSGDIDGKMQEKQRRRIRCFSEDKKSASP